MRNYAITAVLIGALALSACSSSDADTTLDTPVTSTNATPMQSEAPRPDLTDEQTDTVFLQVLDSYSIDYGGDSAAAIRLAHSICSGFDRGLSQLDILPGLQSEGAGYSDADAQNFIDTATVAYCPEHG